MSKITVSEFAENYGISYQQLKGYFIVLDHTDQCWIGSFFNRVSGSGSGCMAGKNDPQKKKKKLKISRLKCRMFFFGGAGGFFCSLKAFMGGL
jgi:hypothetical protein